MLVRHSREALDICNVTGWITNAFAENRPRIFVD